MTTNSDVYLIDGAPILVQEHDENGWILLECHGVTSLFTAIEENNLVLVKYFVEQGTNIYQTG